MFKLFKKKEKEKALDYENAYLKFVIRIIEIYKDNQEILTRATELKIKLEKLFKLNGTPTHTPKSHLMEAILEIDLNSIKKMVADYRRYGRTTSSHHFSSHQSYYDSDVTLIYLAKEQFNFRNEITSIYIETLDFALFISETLQKECLAETPQSLNAGSSSTANTSFTNITTPGITHFNSAQINNTHALPQLDATPQNEPSAVLNLSPDQKR